MKFINPKLQTSLNPQEFHKKSPSQNFYKRTLSKKYWMHFSNIVATWLHNIAAISSFYFLPLWRFMLLSNRSCAKLMNLNVKF